MGQSMGALYCTHLWQTLSIFIKCIMVGMVPFYHVMKKLVVTTLNTTTNSGTQPQPEYDIVQTYHNKKNKEENVQKDQPVNEVRDEEEKETSR
jgi:hypothetical protein